MAQVVEHILGKDEVTSSNLVSSSGRPQVTAGVFFVCIREKGAEKQLLLFYSITALASISFIRFS